MGTSTFDKAIWRAVAAGDGDQLKECIYDMETDQLGQDHFPDRNFDLLLKVINQPEYLRMEKSWHLLKIFDFERNKLSVDQIKRLLATLEVVYDKFSDWMSCFFITEFIPSRFSSESTYELLRRLAGTKQITPRSFVPHGFEHLVTDANDDVLSSKAFTGLLEMKKDPSEDVRYEVAVSLFRLSKLCKGNFAKDAISALSQMRNDASERVRNVADEAL